MSCFHSCHLLIYSTHSSQADVLKMLSTSHTPARIPSIAPDCPLNKSKVSSVSELPHLRAPASVSSIIFLPLSCSSTCLCTCCFSGLERFPSTLSLIFSHALGFKLSAAIFFFLSPPCQFSPQYVPFVIAYLLIHLLIFVSSTGSKLHETRNFALFTVVSLVPRISPVTE